MSVYERNYHLRSKDVDMYRRLRTSVLFEWLQEAAITHTEALGMGRDKTLDRGLLWVVTMQKAEILRMPVYDEKITLRSWPGETMHVFFPRHYILADEKGGTLVRANALWMLVDRDSRRMVFPDRYGIVIDGCSVGEELPLPSAPARLPIREEKCFSVPFSYVDLNGHMNNTRYFDLMEDALPAAAEGRLLREISTEYTSEVCLGDDIMLRWGEESGCFYLEGILEKPRFRMAMRYE